MNFIILAAQTLASWGTFILLGQMGLLVFILGIVAACIVSPWFLLLAALPIVITLLTQ